MGLRITASAYRPSRLFFIEIRFFSSRLLSIIGMAYAVFCSLKLIIGNQWLYALVCD